MRSEAASEPGEGSGPAGVVELLVRVCRVVVSETGCDGAGVHLVGADPVGDEPREAVAAASDGWARYVGELEQGLGEGPVGEALALGRPVLTGDLTRAVALWPGYGPAALEAGVAAVFAFPLQVGAAKLGVLTTLRAAPGGLTRDDVAAVLALVEVGIEILLDGQLPGAAGPDGPGFLTGLDLGDEIYQAQGMVTVHLGVELPEALALLRAKAYGRGQPLRELALEVVAGRVRLSDNGEESDGRGEPQ